MTPTRRLASRPAALPAIALALLGACALAGCSKKEQPLGDASGEDLVVYTTDEGRAAGDQYIALYDLDVGGFRGLPNLDDAGSEGEPCISNDGRFIAFSATRGSGTTGSDLYIYDRLLRTVQSRPTLNTGRDETWPRFAYDSVELAFARRVASGEKRVKLYAPVADTLIALPGLDGPSGVDDDMPAPNVNGSRIAFVSNRAGTLDVLVWNRAGGLATIPALASPGLDTEPALTANGRWLAFASDRPGGAGGFDVYLYDLTADSLVTLPGLNSAGNDRHPSVSASGDMILFQSDRSGGGGRNDLYRYIRSNAAVDQPAAFKSASDDIQPYLKSQ